MAGNRKAKDELSTSGVYVISDKVAGMAYVGSTVNGYRRLHQHLSDLKANKHPNPGLQKAFNDKHPLTYHFVPSGGKFDIKDGEQELLDNLFDKNVLYNVSNKSTPSGIKGRRLSPEHIEKVRITSTGRKHTEEAKAKMSANMRGIKKSPEQAKRCFSVIAPYIESKKISVTIDGIEYPSILAASKATGISNSTLAARVSKHGRTL